MPGSAVPASSVDGPEDADVVGDAAGGLDAAGWLVGRRSPAACEYDAATARSVTTSTARRATRRSVGTS
jgi:hypothetical protein